MVIKTKELADKHGWYWPNQFDNEANAYVHEVTTGPEILEAMGEVDSLDHLFLAYGTGGTLNGVSKVLKDRSPKTKIHVVEPDNGKDILIEEYTHKSYAFSHQKISNSIHASPNVVQ